MQEVPGRTRKYDFWQYTFSTAQNLQSPENLAQTDSFASGELNITLQTLKWV